MNRKFALFVCLAAAGLSTGRAWACNVPVFRYALERWAPDDFVIMAPATPTNLVAALQAARINLFVETKDTTQATVYYPNAGTNSTLWSGPFTAENIRVLVDSPARRSLVKEIQQGASAVWVLLESGNAKADDAAAKLAETELAKLQSELRIPEVDPDDPRTADNDKLKILFKILRVSRTDPAERLFVEMLLGEGTDLREISGPILFPVFGRGRALAGLAGKELNAAHITDAAAFLCGACSCEVKAQNPGWDLLIAANWDDMIENPVVKDPELPPLISLSAMAASAQPSTKPVAAPPPTTPGKGALTRNLLLVLGIVVIVVLAGSFWAKRKP